MAYYEFSHMPTVAYLTALLATAAYTNCCNQAEVLVLQHEFFRSATMIRLSARKAGIDMDTPVSVPPKAPTPEQEQPDIM